MLTVAIQYPSFGPQHPPRLKAIVKASPYPNPRVVAMEMFKKDSDYEWDPVTCANASFERYTVIDRESAVARGTRRELRVAVDAALDDLRPDVLVVNGWGHVESRMSLDWARRNGSAVVLLSDSPRDNVHRYWWKELYKRYVIRGSRSAFVAGTPQARYVEKLGIPKGKVFYPGSCVVDNDYWRRETRALRERGDQLRAELGLPQNYFLSVSRFIPFKNLSFLLEAYGIYRHDPENEFGLVLCGSGPEEAKLRAMIARLGLKDVHLPGFRQVDELPAFYALASCFVFPSSHFEPWGLVANEAMASRLPVLVSRMCGCAEDLVHEDVNGYTFDPTDSIQLAEFMARISENDQKLAAMGQASLEIIEQHSCGAGARNLWKAVDAALNTHRRTA